MSSSSSWRAVGAALARQSAAVPVMVKTPDDFLSSFLNSSAASAVQRKFAAGVKATREAADVSSASAASALLLAELRPLSEVMRPVAFAVRSGEPQLVKQVVQVLQWLDQAEAVWSEPAAWEDTAAAGDARPANGAGAR